MAIRTMTGEGLVTHALVGIQAIDPNETPTDNEIDDGLDALTFMLGEWAGPPDYIDAGLKMWIREELTLTLTAKASFEFKISGGDHDIEPPESLISVILRTTDDQDTPLTVMTVEDYNSITDKTQEGAPTKYYYQREKDKGMLYLDYVPDDTTDTLIITYRRRIESPTASGNIDMPDVSFRALKWSLAVELYPEYLTGDIKLITHLATEARAKLSTKYPENATDDAYFQPGLD